MVINTAVKSRGWRQTLGCCCLCRHECVDGDATGRCKRQRSVPGGITPARRSAIILSDSESDTDMEGSSQPTASGTAPGLRAVTGRHVSGRQQQAVDCEMDWESEAAELAEEEASLEVLACSTTPLGKPVTTPHHLVRQRGEAGLQA